MRQRLLLVAGWVAFSAPEVAASVGRWGIRRSGALPPVARPYCGLIADPGGL
ncbi:MAG: hypothetical protein QNJ77_05065 [Acidimicrobiia bacterium]|nr:hypothetical protein [Acidimicrobiia bacterium]